MSSSKWIPPLSVSSSWRCGCCEELMYNLTESGQPAAGAPLPHYLDQTRPKVCSLCHFLHRGLTDIAERLQKQTQIY
jgi:hypothetical protein